VAALPIYSDYRRHVLLRPDGQLLVVDRGRHARETRAIATSAESRLRTLALIAAAEAYPELRSLLPPRPSNTRDCFTCAGRAFIGGTGTPHRIRCAQCSGLGWVDRDSLQALSQEVAHSPSVEGIQILGNVGSVSAAPLLMTFVLWDRRELAEAAASALGRILSMT